MELVLSSLNVYLFDITVNDLQCQYEVSSENSLLVLVPKIGKLIKSGAERMKLTTNIFVTYVCLLCPAPTSHLPPPKPYLQLLPHVKQA